MTTPEAGRFAGKVVLISGAGRGQGRQFSIDFAREGADIIGFDICHDIPGASTPMATAADLAETRDAVTALGRRMVTAEADVRDYTQVEAAVKTGVAELGPISIIVAAAGIVSDTGPFWTISLQGWQDTIDINLTGVWHTIRAGIPSMLDADQGGSVILISSAGATKGFANISSYVAAKTALVGLLRPMAAELGPHNIRVNSVSPTNVATPMYLNDTNKKLFVPHIENPTDQEYEAASRPMHVLPVGWIETRDSSAAVRFLASDDARYITGLELRVDAGVVVR